MTTTINTIKDRFDELVGEDIVITVEAGRRKTKIHKGVLTETYPSVFVVELNNEGEESYERVSFSYADVLTDSIEIVFPDHEVELVAADEAEKE